MSSFTQKINKMSWADIADDADNEYNKEQEQEQEQAQEQEQEQEQEQDPIQVNKKQFEQDPIQVNKKQFEQDPIQVNKDELTNGINIPLNGIVLTYRLFDLLDGRNRVLFNTNHIEEITKIMIGKNGFYLKHININSGVLRIWCRNENPISKVFDVHIRKDDLYGGHITFWALKKRANEVVNEFYLRRFNHFIRFNNNNLART